MEIRFPKLYRYDRIKEHCSVAVPFAKGTFRESDRLAVFQGGVEVPSQSKVTSYYADGSVRYLFVRFMADLPGNKKAVLTAEKVASDGNKDKTDIGLYVEKTKNGVHIKSSGNGLEFEVSDNSANIFDYLKDAKNRYSAGQFEGPYLESTALPSGADAAYADKNAAEEEQNTVKYGVKLGTWSIEEAGPLVAVLRCMGICVPDDNTKGMTAQLPTFELKLTAYAGKPWVEVSYRLINSTDSALHINSLVFALKKSEDAVFDASLDERTGVEKGDSVGEGSAVKGEVSLEGPVYETTGVKQLAAIEAKINANKEKEACEENGFVRTCVGSSNYKTNFTIAENGIAVERVVDAKYLVGEANEHFTEVFYGTFFADRTDDNGGVCATIYQAQQNYPKAVKADESGIYVMLVPKNVDRVVMQPGMSREQKFLLYFHSAEESLTEIDNRSLIYQMPDRPFISSDVFKDAGVMPDIFVDRDKINYDVEISLIAKCDDHSRCSGMLNFGDAPDMGYTKQGRGKGKLVWSNNEYDFPHACALLYARTGERRFLDYMIAAGSHWMDVDVCHYSDDELLIGGQWEHTRGHCVDGCMVCSHEWVEGLLDYYHFTGDERAYETALGIGENVLRLLETPMYQTSGESNARETGWALRTLTALYVETGDAKWTAKCRWIVGHFEEWTREYGEWLAPYTDNTAIRIGFMISVAVGSLMRYYRVFPSDELKKLILSAVDDLVDNCLMDNGLFYYKELPSLDRLGGNTLLLEALTIGYELTGEVRYLEYGKRTFWRSINAPSGGNVNEKNIVDDAVVTKGGSPKNFGQCMIPLSVYYKAASDNGVI
jgi:hypothetical protein